MFEFDLVGINENLEVVNLGSKTVYNLDNGGGANLWVREETKGLKCDLDLPKLSSALSVKQKGYSNLCENGFGYFYSNGNNVLYNKNNVSYFSSCFSGKSGIPVIKENVRKTFDLFTARVIMGGEHAKWYNLYDEYMKPNINHHDYEQYSYDSVIYTLFNSKSQQSSLRQVEYKDKLWDIKNEFFWMSKDRMKELADENGYDNLYNDARTSSDRHVYNLLFGEERIYDKLSEDAKSVLDKATELVEQSIQMRQVMADEHNHLDSWDAGYAQLKLVWKEYFEEDFKEFRQLYKNLEDRMRPLVYELGFLMK